MSYLVFGCFCITLFCLASLSYKKRGNALEAIIIIWHLLIAINLLAIFVVARGDANRWPHLLHLSAAIALLHGPSLLLYCRSILRIEEKFRWQHTIHAVPFAIAVLMQLTIPWLQPPYIPAIYAFITFMAIASVIRYLSIIYRMGYAALLRDFAPRKSIL